MDLFPVLDEMLQKGQWEHYLLLSHVIHIIISNCLYACTDDDIRQEEGSKNVSLGNVLSAGYKDTKVTFLGEADKVQCLYFLHVFFEVLMMLIVLSSAVQFVTLFDWVLH